MNQEIHPPGTARRIHDLKKTVERQSAQIAKHDDDVQAIKERAVRIVAGFLDEYPEMSEYQDVIDALVDRL